MMTLGKTAAAMVVAAAIGTSASAAPASPAPGSAQNALKTMSEVNLIVLQDSKAAADVEGKTYVGGNVTGGGTLGLGNTANHQTAVDSYHSTLAVGGTNSAQLNVKHGNGSGNSYGAYIVGSSGQLDISDPAATVRIGGTASSINLGARSRTEVGGSMTSLNLGAGTPAARRSTRSTVPKTMCCRSAAASVSAATPTATARFSTPATPSATPPSPRRSSPRSPAIPRSLPPT